MNEKLEQSFNEIHEALHLKDIKSNRFIYNDYGNGKQVLKSVLDHLGICSEFMFSVAFISDDGLSKLKLKLKELSYKDIKGRILTTNYLLFNDPKALRDIMAMPNVEIRMYCSDVSKHPGFHTKGYIFKENFNYTAIIGSANMTQNALTVNKEWNTEITGGATAIAIKEILSEYEQMWKDAVPMSDIIDEYENQYNEELEKKKQAAKLYKKITKETKEVKPNAMQEAFIVRLNELIDSGETRGLLISATGTGKTYASAFGIQNIRKFKANKVLFITHRETILKQAKETYDKVFGGNIKTSLYSGNSKDIEGADYIFASYSLLIRNGVKEQFDPSYFDVVIIDEVHRVGDNHDQDIIEYFKPKFLLGMSATPDRTDNYDIYALFDHNIIYEIRLMTALESSMLAPFNYYGLVDLTVDGEIVDDKSDFNKLTSDERVDNIIKQATYYGFSGSRVKGLVFVSGIEIGKSLSEEFNKKGYRTVFLEGSSTQKYRDKCIEMLEKEEKTGDYLDYIFTVDIFNEGVDIPSVNQIILLRPTESAIIFIQQLGRGLRLFEGKQYVNILDFIGNYEKNFLIAKAFTKKKITSSSVVKTVTEILPGKSSVQFEEVAKEMIYQSIDKAKLTESREVTREYFDVKNRLGRIPTLKEFEELSSLSARVFLDMKIYPSYYDFLIKKDKDYKPRFSEHETLILRYISKYIADGKRKCDVDFLEHLSNSKCLSEKYNFNTIEELSVCSLFNGEFVNSSTSCFTKNKVSLIVQKGKNYLINPLFGQSLANPDFKSMIEQLIEVAYHINSTVFGGSNDFVLFEKYNRCDVCRLINLPVDEHSVMYGYKLYKDYNAFPIFITYKKVLDDSSSTNYNDEFVDEYSMSWISKNGFTLKSDKIKEILKACDSGQVKVHLFVQKGNSKYVKDDGHFYLGECVVTQDRKNIKMAGNQDAVNMLLALKTPVRKDIYDYLISPLSNEDK